jgi:hypothetical protein
MGWKLPATRRAILRQQVEACRLGQKVPGWWYEHATSFYM